jgi:outer membrane protein
MKRNRSIELLTAIVATSLLAGASAHAQVSEARLRELVQAALLNQAQGPFTFSAQAPTGNGPTVPLTIDDAVKFALERNLDIAVQRVNPEIRDISVAAALAVYHPTLTSNISRSSSTSTPTNQLTIGSTGSTTVTGTTTYNAGITQSLPWWGSSLNAQFQNNRQDSTSNNVTFNPTYTSTWQATFTQPLLRGRTIDASRRTIFVSKVNRDMSDIQLKASLSNLVSNVRNAYWDFVYATEAVDAARQSLTLATQLVEDNTIKVEVGTLAPLDIVSARAAQAQRQQTLTTAEGTRRTSELALKRLIVGGTDDPNWMATLDPVDRPEFQPAPVNVQAGIARALENRTDLAIVKQNLALNDESLKMYHNSTLPAVDFQLSYGLNGVGGTQLIRDPKQLGSPITQTIPGGEGDALSALLRGKNPRWTVGVNVTYPLGLNSSDTTLATAQVQLSQVKAQLKTIELQVANDITQAAINLQNTAEAVQAAQQSTILSQQQLEAERSKFDVGMSTNYTIVQYQRDLNDAKNSELRAILNYRKAQVEWDRLQETTLASSSIQIL